MKKLLVLSALCFCFSVGFASTSTNTAPKLTDPNSTDQKSQKETTKKKVKYDFSLFKFITPTKQESQSDTLKLEKASPKQKTLKGEISEIYEKSRCFLMFS